MSEKYIRASYLMEALGTFNDRVNGNEHFLNGIDTAKEIVENAPAANVQPTEEVSDAVDEALRVLNAINSSGRLDYGDYCELYDVISAICGAETTQN